VIDFKALIERIAEHEGFGSNGRVYKCSEGVDTFGHGFTYITEEESMDILSKRIPKKHLKLLDKIDWYKDLPPMVQGVIIEMTFQIGTSGMLKFKKMIANMKAKNWKGAADEMKDSLWYRQTKTRCEKLASIVLEHE
jgi:GH24 family phage-related lysozyme (muramidase)